MKQVGQPVGKDETLVEIESDKATVDLPAPESGSITEILKQQGETVAVGDLIGYLEPGEVEETDGAAKAGKKAASNQKKEKKEKKKKQKKKKQQEKDGAQEKTRSAARQDDVQEIEQEQTDSPTRVMPAAQRLLAEHGLQPSDVQATGPGGRLLKEDVLKHVESKRADTAVRSKADVPAAASNGRQEEVTPMSPLRKRIAQRLVEAQQTAALLTTFNEVDLSAVIELRKQHRETFQEKHGVKLGFMSFFVKATIEALKDVPQLNAEIRGEQIVYRNYYDIGVAVSGRKGLVVPVLRGAQRMSFAEIEAAIADFGRRAAENKITLDELQGGTFTISNGGVFGSLLSTPIVNPPQSGILGMHAIQERPVAIDGQVAVRPMMYLALTYDHRIVDGREAVTFLVHIKNLIQQPARMLLEI
jgi:2-oxoglutarate dehydrogenase E2 component (dihydrolipoamide succinyltransferase)